MIDKSTLQQFRQIEDVFALSPMEVEGPLENSRLDKFEFFFMKDFDTLILNNLLVQGIYLFHSHFPTFIFYINK